MASRILQRRACWSSSRYTRITLSNACLTPWLVSWSVPAPVTTLTTLRGNCTGCRSPIDFALNCLAMNAVNNGTSPTYIANTITHRYRPFLVTSDSVPSPQTSTRYRVSSPCLQTGRSGLRDHGNGTTFLSEIRYISAATHCKRAIDTFRMTNWRSHFGPSTVSFVSLHGVSGQL